MGKTRVGETLRRPLLLLLVLLLLPLLLLLLLPLVQAIPTNSKSMSLAERRTACDFSGVSTEVLSVLTMEMSPSDGADVRGRSEVEVEVRPVSVLKHPAKASKEDVDEVDVEAEEEEDAGFGSVLVSVTTAASLYCLGPAVVDTCTRLELVHLLSEKSSSARQSGGLLKGR